LISNSRATFEFVAIAKPKGSGKKLAEFSVFIILYRHVCSNFASVYGWADDKSALGRLRGVQAGVVGRVVIGQREVVGN
jgi:hypothetical protein